MISKSISKELTHARELCVQAKFGEALEIIEKLENSEPLSQEDLLSALLIKGNIYVYNQVYEKAVNSFEHAYQISQSLGLVHESVKALIGKAFIGFIGDLDNASTYIMDAEKRLNSLADDSSKGKVRRDLLFIKIWIHLLKGDLNKAVKSGKKCLRLVKEEKIGDKLDLARIYYLLGWLNEVQSNHTKALDFAMKSLALNKELNHSVAIASDYSLIARIYVDDGNYDKALQYCKLSSSINEIAERARLAVLQTFGVIYISKSQLNRALKYLKQAVALAEASNITDQLRLSLIYLGFLYRAMGKNNLVIEHIKRNLTLSEKAGNFYHIVQSLMLLIFTYIEENSREKANQYFTRLSELYNQTRNSKAIFISVYYLSSKAYILKTSTRMRDRVEAQALLKELISHTNLPFKDVLISAISNLCDLLMEELSRYNDPKIIDEILPLITKSLNIAEEAHNYNWLAETKLLQAKLALIQTNIEEAKRLMVEAQRIADLHGLNLLAWGISTEHDKLLDQIDLWEQFKEEETPLSERIKLASTNGVLERIQGKRAVEPPELVKEDPILLLIMDNSGATYFNHPFIANWDHSDLFSSFMSAFNTFSDEIFSKSIDRIRIGENTILMKPVEPFLTCYVINGQSYPALQKLSRFTEAIRENVEIWQALIKSVKTSEILELDKPPALKTVIDEIF
ncbi:MAG: tetratricopeptide repeat protein [Candidatus Thorarchaeota archaeon]